MKRWFYATLLIFVIVLLSSCGKKAPLEDLTLALILGIDLDDENNLVFYEINPVFSEGAKKGTESYEVKAKTIRESRRLFDSLTTGEVTAGKIQVLLVGKRVLQHGDWFPILDTVYRNPAFSMSTRVVTVDGPVKEVVFHNPEEKPQLSLHLKALIDKNYDRTRAVKGTLQELHREIYEKGTTPFISEVKKEKNIELTGISLLDDKGKYAQFLNVPESSLLLMLQNKKRHEITLTIPVLPNEKEKNIFHKNVISFAVNKVKTEIKSGYKQNKFRFDIKIKMTINIVERLFPEDKLNNGQLTKKIEKVVKKQTEDLIKKIQKKNIDPIGLGLYARAYQYTHYKKVENNWGQALADSDVNVSVKIDINTKGAVEQ
ncbi:Ger(x)C family spore germination protein [Neobacillus sp. DY30]|uniref:Ger(x)C family spore germination protein n=1 Tax=Neobacillus sp. DY30 TaxID=3047871 RepID=UPI0024BFDDFB|nr:Ger(x)C family spore germination protein [Neobacillus sp. DY30]WHY01621.1 Ger(x)C family spore germination protein [Neobacillus sp. DY30]